MNVLTAEHIFLSFGSREVLKGVAVRIEQHKITGLLGRNGAGKSTMLKVVFGIKKAEDAIIASNGRKVYRAYETKGLINYLPQKSFLPTDRKMKKILADYSISADEVIDLFPELEHDLDKKVPELSGGTERLWSAVLVLLSETRYTLLDEPFSHIMPLHVDRLKQLIERQKAKKGILLTDHMYRHLLDVSDTLYLMKEGKSIFIKDRENLVLHGYLRQLDEV